MMHSSTSTVPVSTDTTATDTSTNSNESLTTTTSNLVSTTISPTLRSISQTNQGTKITTTSSNVRVGSFSTNSEIKLKFPPTKASTTLEEFKLTTTEMSVEKYKDVMTSTTEAPTTTQEEFALRGILSSFSQIKFNF